LREVELSLQEAGELLVPYYGSSFQQRVELLEDRTSTRPRDVACKVCADARVDLEDAERVVRADLVVEVADP